jgi:hypothetical protein
MQTQRTATGRIPADVIPVRIYQAGQFVGQRFYGPDAGCGPHGASVIDTSGVAARLIVEAVRAAGKRGRARSGLEKVLRAANFSDPGRAFAFAMDHDRVRGQIVMRCWGDRCLYFSPEVAP